MFRHLSRTGGLARPFCLALAAQIPVQIPARTPAHAHAVLDRKEAAAGAAYRGVVRIMHGCEGSPTTRVTVTIPEGVTGAKPMPKPGWQVSTTRGPYAKANPSFHGKVTEGVKTITWSGGALPDDQIDEFTFFARISDAFAPGTDVHFPVRQDCETGSIAWDEVPGADGEARALKAPAPSVRIRAAATAAGTGTSARAGSVEIRAPWLRATPNGAKVAGGYVTLVNDGTEADRLVGASIAQAGRGEIHTMSVENGVMRMAPVEGGLPVAPGGTVELKPGGLHLMFLDLKQGLKAGETVSGTLVFEKAGAVPVTFAVAPIGAQGLEGKASEGKASASGHAHHH